ncbi:MAG: hypothetical protein H7X95_02700 [Deltaproteobacteria bacterium]|nr:hypothetical protein [Deltaproteobacteria bacterium]
MVSVSIENSTAIFAVQGLHKLWAFKSRLAFPLAHVADVRVADPVALRGWWKGIRLPGTRVPGVIIAGTFYKDGKRIFWDVRNATRAIIVDLTDESYAQLIVEVPDPSAEVARFQAAPLT